MELVLGDHSVGYQKPYQFAIRVVNAYRYLNKDKKD